ncbi:uncharacterized protein [Onthophagus taurus]|uniref:uncharacterized protein n=1 Tax=Onthophagus taurus TaxID=166361 RepID=UPI000C205765|nr:uncharacterized protein LOC111426304 [Onthophagus taurus]
MFRNDQQPQQWTVHAEFTIKHDGLDDVSSVPVTHTERDENGVKMVYTWTSQDNPSSSRSTDRSTPEVVKDPQLPYGFQKGNLVFTSTPPKRQVDSSGYGSELLSPNSSTSRQQQNYNRRCRSTCSIILSTDFNEAKPDHQDCGRTQSLRCQTPTVRSERRDSFYGCGDPWCYHACNEDYCRFPTVQECDEYSGSSKRPSRASTFNVRSKSSPPKFDAKKDASVQTYEMIDKCTSPFPGSERKLSSESNESKLKRQRQLNRKSSYGNTRRKTEPIYQRTTPSTFSPDSLDNQSNVKRTVKAPKGQLSKTSTPDSKSSEKKPRTVHIDVYCTGTELESSSSCSDSETNKTTSSPQTVFESEKFRLTHKRVDNDLPFTLRKNESKDSKISTDSLKKSAGKEESDNDGDSTAYPSQRSSYSNIKDFRSSLSSVPPSWSTMSMSSYALPDDDSVANTSWKDTYSDLGSLLESRSSLAQTESLDFVPRKLIQRESIDEAPEITGRGSLQPSDSFEYANSEDKARIKQMERMWGNDAPNSAQIQKKHLVQQKKLQEYMDKRMSSNQSIPKWRQSKDSDSGTDSDEKGWDVDPKKVAETVVKCAEKKIQSDPSRTPSILAIKQKLSLDPTLSSPFTMFPGVYTDQRTVARRFGNIVNVFKKPGHHIGPAKNPDCMCDHCRQYFQTYAMRGRARSWGDSQVTMNWKEMARASVPRDSEHNRLNKPDEGYTDF